MRKVGVCSLRFRLLFHREPLLRPRLDPDCAVTRRADFILAPEFRRQVVCVRLREVPRALVRLSCNPRALRLLRARIATPRQAVADHADHQGSKIFYAPMIQQASCATQGFRLTWHRAISGTNDFLLFLNIVSTCFQICTGNDRDAQQSCPAKAARVRFAKTHCSPDGTPRACMVWPKGRKSRSCFVQSYCLHSRRGLRAREELPRSFAPQRHKDMREPATIDVPQQFGPEKISPTCSDQALR